MGALFSLATTMYLTNKMEEERRKKREEELKETEDNEEGES